MEGKAFVEKDFYSNPPELPANATKKETQEAWAEWIKKDAKGRANHKRAHTKAQKPGDLPDFDINGIMIKQGGVWKQRPGMTAFVGSSDAGTLETVMYQGPEQDCHFQARGKSGGRNSSKGRRNNLSRKEAKRQFILNQRR